MAGRFSRSWSLASASWQVLKQDTQLLVFPLVSTIAAVVVAGAFALGGLGMWSYDGLSRLSGERLPNKFYVLGFAFYVCLYFVIFFYTPLVVTVVALAVVALMGVALAQAALMGIYSAALYRYATTGSGGAGFDPGVLQGAVAREER